MPKTRRAVLWYFSGAIALLALVFVTVKTRHLYSSAVPVSTSQEEHSLDEEKELGLRLETVHPRPGGFARHTSQPGSAHSFESAELFSKVSGFLKAQHVDIGTVVKQGDLLCEIDIPELVKDVEAAAAASKQAEAEVAQAEARVESAIADQKAMQSRVAQAQADLERFDSEVKFSQKQYDRISELNGLKSIEARIVDERLLQLQSAQAAHRAGQSAVTAAEQQAAAAEARISLARADLEVSRARLRVAQSQLERAKVMESYTRILSPYDGVVTSRNFHRGAYVRSPDQGGQVSLLAVDRTDKMRVLVRVPEREVPYVQPGDKTTIRFDALPQRVFEGTVSRIANAEESATRTMLAEVDVLNPEGLIRDHMYGRVEMVLDEPSPGVTVPSTCLVGDVANGEARLFVVENGIAKLRPVRVGKDSGIDVEVISGLEATDRVVVRPPGGLLDGAAVASITPAAAAPIASSGSKH